jgi:hypothetical protein
MLIYYIIYNKNNKANLQAITMSYTSIIISCFLSLLTNIATILLGKKKYANDFSLRRTCHWHLLSAIGSCLAVNWQVGQLINFLFGYIALYSAIGSRLAVNWQVGQLISN